MASGGNKPTTTQKTTSELGPEQKSLFELAFPMAKDYASKPLQQFQGTGIADFSPEENTAKGQLKDLAPKLDKIAGQAEATNSKLMDPAFMLDVGNNSYLRNATDATTGQVTRNLNENILPKVRSGATQAGGMYSGGSSREGIAEAGAIGKTNQGLSDTIASQYFDTYQKGLGQLGEAVDRNPSVMAQQLIGPEVLSAVGAQDRGLKQSQLDEDIQKFYTGQALPMIQSQDLLKLINGMPGGSTTSTATGAVPKTSPWVGTIGGAGSGAAVGSIFGPYGTILGALLGGGAGYFGSK